ncbi:hypothetical protein CCP4SC76_3080002 [Gammaproteobacteria bacterium]
MGGMTRVHIDCETFSRADLPRTGAHQYARDPSTECLMVAYARDDCLGFGPVQLWDCTTAPMPDDLHHLLHSDAVTLCAFNAGFEQAVFEHCLGMPFDPSRWLCVQALALSFGFPGSLAGVGDALSLKGDKAKSAEGAKLIRKFSIPQPKTGHRILPAADPKAWAAFCEYCRQDVVAEYEIYRRLSQ